MTASVVLNSDRVFFSLLFFQEGSQFPINNSPRIVEYSTHSRKRDNASSTVIIYAGIISKEFLLAKVVYSHRNWERNQRRSNAENWRNREGSSWRFSRDVGATRVGFPIT